MKISVKVYEATLEEMIIFEAVCKPLIEEVLEQFLCEVNSSKVEKEND